MEPGTVEWSLTMSIELLRTAVEEVPEVTTTLPEAVDSTPPLPALTLGGYGSTEAAGFTEPTYAAIMGATTDAELFAVEAHCRLKAEGIRWAATRRRRMEEGAEFRVEIAPR